MCYFHTTVVESFLLTSLMCVYNNSELCVKSVEHKTYNRLKGIGIINVKKKEKVEEFLWLVRKTWKLFLVL